MGVLRQIGRRLLILTGAANEARHMPHRAYVGGHGANWESIGRLQFNFLVAQGLRPQHVLLDIACGSLRGGILFIPYLNHGNYLGIDSAADLIKAGVDFELGQTLFEIKRPELAVSSCFEFEKFSQRPDFAIAQSLFTHLVEADIHLCMNNLQKFSKKTTRLFATFHESSSIVGNPAASDPHLGFYYTRDQMSEFGLSAGWVPRYIGPWDHPRNQMMFEYTVAV